MSNTDLRHDCLHRLGKELVLQGFAEQGFRTAGLQNGLLDAVGQFHRLHSGQFLQVAVQRALLPEGRGHQQQSQESQRRQPRAKTGPIHAPNMPIERRFDPVG